jgi:hypothetical protein
MADHAYISQQPVTLYPPPPAKMFKPDQYLKIKTFCIFLLAIWWSLYVYRRGVVMSPDSYRFSTWADILIKFNFNPFDFIENSYLAHPFPPNFYFNFVTIAAISKVLLGENWGLGVVVVNLLAGVFAALILVKATLAITGKPACAIFAGLFLLLCHDFYLWMPYVLSDTLFSIICFSIFILITSLYQQPAEHLKRVVGIIILLCYAMFFRPSWPPLLMFAILSVPLVFFFSLKTADSNERHNFLIRCVLLACIFIPAIIFCNSYFMLHPDKWPFPVFGDTISHIAPDYHQGIVLREHTETFHSPSSDILSFALISAHKLVAFFYLSVDSYSFKHTLYNYIFFPPLYGLSIFAIVKLFKKDNGPAFLNWWFIFSCTLFIFGFAFFHSLLQIDSDFRYRVPCLLPLIFLAGLGLNELINGFSKRA